MLLLRVGAEVQPGRGHWSRAGGQQESANRGHRPRNQEGAVGQAPRKAGLKSPPERWADDPVKPIGVMLRGRPSRKLDVLSFMQLTFGAERLLPIQE